MQAIAWIRELKLDVEELRESLMEEERRLDKDSKKTFRRQHQELNQRINETERQINQLLQILLKNRCSACERLRKET
jgi:predicted transposase YdaD